MIYPFVSLTLMVYRLLFGEYDSKTAASPSFAISDLEDIDRFFRIGFGMKGVSIDSSSIAKNDGSL